MKKILSLCLALIFCFVLSDQIYASDYIDEITDFEITVDVNNDGTLQMLYHVEWLVLDDEEGPLIWAEIGIPNKHFTEYKALTSNVSDIYYNSSNGTIHCNFENGYYEGETAVFEFSVLQDYMYAFTNDNELAVYQFTPAWFDYADVDHLVVHWNKENVYDFSPSAIENDTYYDFETSLKGGEKFNITVRYLPDVYNFDTERGYDTQIEDDKWDWLYTLIGALMVLIPVGFIVFVPIIYVFYGIKILASGFKMKKVTKIKRTLIEYYPECPNCGAQRGENDTVCKYCGTNFIKSEEVIEEDDPKYNKYQTSGIFTTSSPNIFVNVHTRSYHVPTYTKPVIPKTSRSPSSHNRHHNGGGGGSCACASSCACACASSCACACASSGGGRAGCSLKDFYNTNLTTAQLLKRNKTNNNKLNRKKKE